MTRLLYYFFEIWPLTAKKICPRYNNFVTAGSKFCKFLNKPSEIAKDNFKKFYQNWSHCYILFCSNERYFKRRVNVTNSRFSKKFNLPTGCFRSILRPSSASSTFNFKRCLNKFLIGNFLLFLNWQCYKTLFCNVSPSL